MIPVRTYKDTLPLPSLLCTFELEPEYIFSAEKLHAEKSKYGQLIDINFGRNMHST